MSEILHVTVMGKNYPLNIEYQDCPESPRDWDNIGTMCCLTQSHYTLGDEQFSNSDEYCFNMYDHLSLHAYRNLMNERFSEAYLDAYTEEPNEKGLVQARKWIERNLIVLPVYLYDHSGLSLSTVPFSCGWDSGQIGFIFCTKEKARKELGVNRLTEKHIEQIKHSLKQEIQVYSDYVGGSVFEYHNEELDIHCNGFFGYDFEENGLLASAKSDILFTIKQKMQQHYRKLKMQISNKVPLAHRATLVF